MLFPRFWRNRTKFVSGSFRAVLAPTHPGWQITIPTGGLLPARVWRNGQPAMRQIYASTEQKPGQRNAFKSVRGSNHPVWGPRDLFTQTESCHPFPGSEERQSCLDRARGPTGGFPHWGKGKPMMWRGAVYPQCRQVFRSGIALVLSETVLRVDQVPFAHEPVPLDLSQDRSSRDGNRTRIAMNQRFLFDHRVQPHGIQQQIIGSNFQQSQGSGHGLPARLIDIPRVDAARVLFRYSTYERIFAAT